MHTDSSSRRQGRRAQGLPASPIQRCGTVRLSHGDALSVLQTEDAKIFLNDISASSDVFKAYFALLSEVLSRVVKLGFADL